MPTYRGTREQFKEEIRRLAAGVAGKGPTPMNVGEGIALRVGNAFLSQVQQAFVVKSKGGTGSDGITWKPLDRKTVANRRPAPPKKDFYYRPRGMLTASEDRRWVRYFLRRKQELVLRGMPWDDATTNAIAARYAWTLLKGEGAKTKLAMFGDMPALILRDTGKLFQSITPGIADQRSNEPDQVFDIFPGGVTVGTNVPYGEHLHKDRPLWPPTIPTPWADAIGLALGRGFKKALELLYP